MLFTYVAFSLITVTFASNGKQYLDCRDVQNRIGQCMPLLACPSLANLVNHSEKDKLTRKCDEDDDEFVCCSGVAPDLNILQTTTQRHISKKYNNEQSYTKCTTPNQKIGLCVPLENCPYFFKRLTSSNSTQSEINFASRSICKTLGNAIYYCCESSTQSTQRENSVQQPERNQNHWNEPTSPKSVTSNESNRILGKECNDNFGTKGTCKPLHQCEELKTNIARNTHWEKQQILSNLRCGTYQTYPIYCCVPSKNQEDISKTLKITLDQINEDNLEQNKRAQSKEYMSNKLCQYSNGTEGICKLLDNCSHLKNIYDQIDFTKKRIFLDSVRSNCDYFNSKQEYCCTQLENEEPTTPKLEDPTEEVPRKSNRELDYAPCTDYYERDGLCQPLETCSYMKNELKKMFITQKFIDFVVCEPYKKNFNIRNYVCCNKHQNEIFRKKNFIKLPSPPNCGIDGQTDVGEVVDTTIEEFPWVAQIKNEFGVIFCGGNLINENFILTSLSCVDQHNENKLKVILGEHDMSQLTDCIDSYYHEGPDICADAVKEYNVERIIRGENIALLKLREKVIYTKFIKPICLPQNRLEEVSDIVIVGWGINGQQTKSKKKQKSIIRTIPNDSCKDDFQKFSNVLTEAKICAGGHKGMDTCQADVGGGLMRLETNSSTWYLEGIFLKKNVRNRCELVQLPEIFERISGHFKWIEENIQIS